MNQTHYTRLKSGDWGLWIPGDAIEGATVKVATKAGKIRTETIGKIIHRGNKDGKAFCLCSIEGKNGQAQTTTQPSRIKPAGAPTTTKANVGSVICPCCGEALSLEIRKQ